MFVFKLLFPILIVFFVHGACCKPTENELTHGRGMGSTIWGWITYPFSWWGSSDTTEAPPTPDHLIASTIGPYDNVKISSRNVTIWCNDHTCTTMKCDKSACVNTTCSIYDTDVTGQCREYNMGMKPEEPKPNPTSPAPPTVVDKVAAVPEATSTTVIASTQTEAPAVEHPLELEAALSSTLTKASTEATPSGNKPGISSPQNKI